MAVSFFKQRTVRDTQLLSKKSQQQMTTVAPSPATGSVFSQSLNNLSRPKPGLSPEPVRAQHKSGSPVVPNQVQVINKSSFTSRSLETLTRPKSADSPRLLPAIDSNSNSSYTVRNSTSSSSLQLNNPAAGFTQASSPNNTNGNAPSAGFGSGSYLHLGASGSGAGNVIGLSGNPFASVGSNSGSAVSKTVATTGNGTAFLLPFQHQYSIPPLLYLNNLLTVAKLDELRRNSISHQQNSQVLGVSGNAPVPLKSTGNLPSAAALLSVATPSNHTQNESAPSETVSPRLVTKEELERKPPSIQLPPIQPTHSSLSPIPARSLSLSSPALFSCKHCMFQTPFQQKLDQHITCEHASNLGVADKSGRHPEEHNSTGESSPNVSTGSTGNGAGGNVGVGSGGGNGNGGKPFKCPDCSYSTMYENCLKSHQARHSADFEEILQSTHLSDMKGESGYKCTICNNYSTAYKKCLASHLLKHKKGVVNPVTGSAQKTQKPRSLSNKSSNSRSSTNGASDSFRRPTSGSSIIFSDDDQCSSLLDATNRDLTIDEEQEFEDLKSEGDEDMEPSSKRQNMRSSQDYMMEVDEHRHVTSTPEGKVTLSNVKTVNACPFCETIFKSMKMLTIHMSFHGESNPFQCRSCGIVCEDSCEFEIHLIQAPH